jgi:hypothetical protein
MARAAGTSTSVAAPPCWSMAATRSPTATTLPSLLVEIATMLLATAGYASAKGEKPLARGNGSVLVGASAAKPVNTTRMALLRESAT